MFKINTKNVKNPPYELWGFFSGGFWVFFRANPDCNY